MTEGLRGEDPQAMWWMDLGFVELWLRGHLWLEAGRRALGPNGHSELFLCKETVTTSGPHQQFPTCWFFMHCKQESFVEEKWERCE